MTKQTAATRPAKGRRTGTRASTPEAQTIEATKDRSIAKAIDRAVGRRLRELRLMRGLSQAVLAEAVGVSFQQMQKYERGTNRLSASRLVMIARALAARPEELLPGSFDATGADGEMPLSAKAIRLARMFDEIPSCEMREGLYRMAKAAKYGAGTSLSRKETPAPFRAKA